MLLEAHQLLTSLRDAGIAPSATHPDLKRPGKANALRVTLNPKTETIGSIEFVSPEDTLNHWTQADGKKNSFPVSKFSGPLVSPLAKEQTEIFTKAKTLAERANALSQLFSIHGRPEVLKKQLPSKALKNRLLIRFEELRGLEKTLANLYLDLLHFFAESSPEIDTALFSGVITWLEQQAQSAAETEQARAQQVLFNLCFSKGEKAKIPIIWNIRSRSLTGRDSSSPSNFPEVNTVLLESLSTTSSDTIECSLTGESSQATGATFPSPTLPAVGSTPIFSRNKDTDAFERYGRKGSTSFPVGQELSNDLAAALSFLTAPAREGKTWRRIASDQPKKSDLLVISQASQLDRPFADAIGDDQVAVGEGMLEELTKRGLERFAGKSKDQIRGRLFLAIISAVDPGNRKVVLHRNLSLKALTAAVEQWSKICQTDIGRSLPISIEKGKSPTSIRPPVLSPGAIPSLTRVQHLIDGTSYNDKVGGLSMAEALELLLSVTDSNTRGKRRSLNIAYRRLSPLLVNLGSTFYRRPGEVYKIKTDQKWLFLKAQSFLKLLLFSFHRTPSTTMNSLAYQLGQLCASFDIMHLAYCHIERGGDIPPKLIGSVCFQTASRSPVKALASLSSRSAPYLARLRNFHGNKASKFLAKFTDEWSAEKDAIYHFLKIRKLLPSLSEQIASQLNTAEQGIDDIFKAELLLGYLKGPDETSTESQTS